MTTKLFGAAIFILLAIYLANCEYPICTAIVVLIAVLIFLFGKNK